MVLLTPSQIQFSRAIATLPTLFVAPSVPPDALALIQEILEEYYFDGIDDVVSAELDGGGDIVGEFTDRVGAREVKRYRYRIGDDEVSYGLLNSKEVAKFAVIFAPMFGKGSKKGKKKTCTKGTPCGDTCIQASRMCRKKTGSAVKAKIKEAKEKLGGTPKAKVSKVSSEKGKKYTPEEFLKKTVLGLRAEAPTKEQIQKEFKGISIIEFQPDFITSLNTKDEDSAKKAAQEIARRLNQLSNPPSDAEILPKAKKLRSKPEIRTEQEFEKAIEEVNQVLGSDENEIWKIRRSLGNRVSRANFDFYLNRLISKDKYAYKSGSLSGGTDIDKILDSVATKISGTRTSISKL